MGKISNICAFEVSDLFPWPFLVTFPYVWPNFGFIPVKSVSIRFLHFSLIRYVFWGGYMANFLKLAIPTTISNRSPIIFHFMISCMLNFDQIKMGLQIILPSNIFAGWSLVNFLWDRVLLAFLVTKLYVPQSGSLDSSHYFLMEPPLLSTPWLWSKLWLRRFYFVQNKKYKGNIIFHSP